MADHSRLHLVDANEISAILCRAGAVACMMLDNDSIEDDVKNTFWAIHYLIVQAKELADAPAPQGEVANGPQ